MQAYIFKFNSEKVTNSDSSLTWLGSLSSGATDK
jgi:hypothetical protein